MENLVGKVIFACSARAVVVELLPFIVLEQSSFALSVVSARGGVHSIYIQTLQLNGPSRWEVAGWQDEPEQIARVANDLSAMLQDKDLHLSEGAAGCAKLTLDQLIALNARAAFYDPDIGEAFDDGDEEPTVQEAAEILDWDLDVLRDRLAVLHLRANQGDIPTPAEVADVNAEIARINHETEALKARHDSEDDNEDDSEDDSEDEARAAGEAAAEAIAERKLNSETDTLLSNLLPSQTIVIRCQTPEEVEAAFALLFDGRVGN